ncbi:uncharacterized protein LOC116621232 [Nematostella vectensis]|uniref:uncharacterized protein LOC116621232 n=1 Tax=Nematostella vectensis TaxID=45351 RepID=UPI002076F1F2|nr:uncharacterized protein LOC116621232 [Nematostella vectensis]
MSDRSGLNLSPSRVLNGSDLLPSVCECECDSPLGVVVLAVLLTIETLLCCYLVYPWVKKHLAEWRSAVRRSSQSNTTVPRSLNPALLAKIVQCTRERNLTNPIYQIRGKIHNHSPSVKLPHSIVRNFRVIFHRARKIDKNIPEEEGERFEVTEGGIGQELMYAEPYEETAVCANEDASIPTDKINHYYYIGDKSDPSKISVPSDESHGADGAVRGASSPTQVMLEGRKEAGARVEVHYYHTLEPTNENTKTDHMRKASRVCSIEDLEMEEL